MKKRVVIVGAGNTGWLLAERLKTRSQVILLDTSESQFNDYLEPEKAAALDDSPGITCIRGDGTSRLILKALIDPEIQCALVTVSGSDEVNLEVGQLGRSIGYDPIIATQHDSDSTERFLENRITTLNRSKLLAELVDRSLKYHGAVVPTGIGLGKGELLELRLLRTSPILNRPLKDLAPYQWRVSAVFRDDGLIVPTGETRLQIDDRVLLVGDPKILPTVAEYLRFGRPQFPQPYGPNVVTLEFSGSDDTLHDEAVTLAQGCGASQVKRGISGGEDSEILEEADGLMARPDGPRELKHGTFSLPPLDTPAFLSQLNRQRPGVVLVRAMDRSVISRLLGLQGRDSDLCDLLPAPVMFARGSAPYRRIMLTVSGSDHNLRSAELAIDITRQLGASLTAVNVNLPHYLSGLAEEEVHKEITPIRRLCELYEVQLDYHHYEGNPVQTILEEAKNHDLLILSRSFNRPDSYYKPDVALRVARKAPCSVMVLTVRPEG